MKILLFEGKIEIENYINDNKYYFILDNNENVIYNSIINNNNNKIYYGKLYTSSINFDSKLIDELIELHNFKINIELKKDKYYGEDDTYFLCRIFNIFDFIFKFHKDYFKDIMFINFICFYFEKYINFEKYLNF